MTESGLTPEQHAYGLANGHAPIADGVICVDFDATLVRWGGLMDDKRPTDGAKAFMQRLRDEGWKIVIFTSRLSPTWARSVIESQWPHEGASFGWRVSSFLDEQERFVAGQLRKLGIPFDLITAEKVPAIAYIDDRAISYHGDWNAVYAELMP